jgi:para-nitrobenzyl esterase
MKIVSTKLGLLLCILGPAFILTGCPDAVYCSGGTCYGYYYDSLVSGLSYESRNADGVTHSGVTGEDDDPGRFSFAEGGTVSFSIGDLDLGESMGKERVTPFDLAGVDEEPIGGCEVDGPLPADAGAFRKVVNLAILLQTLDADGDPENGIEIPPEVAELFQGSSISLDQDQSTFTTDPGLQDALDEANARSQFPEERTAVEPEQALKALYRGIGLCPAGQ